MTDELVVDVTDQGRLRYPHVAAPIEINGRVLKNRVVRTAHTTGCADGAVTDALIAFHEARARGGVALSIIEYGAVDPSSPTELQAYLDSTIDGWARLAHRMHDYDMKLFQQLWHGGAQGPGYKRPVSGLPRERGPDWAPSAMPGPAGNTTIEMTQAMIGEVVEGFGTAARRCRDAGLDGIEVHAGHGYLPCQFLSPLTNRRDDEYGGSLENRARFVREVMRRIRDAVGLDYPIGIRLSAAEGLDGGIEVNETVRVASWLAEERLIDFLDVSLGAHRTTHLMVGPMHLPPGYQLPTSRPVTRHVDVPTIVAGRFTTLAHCEEVIARGDADLVSMVRAHIADPDLVQKSFSGREDEVRPCIACNEACIGGRRGGSGIVECAVNPNVVPTSDLYPRASVARRVLVVGAGPAGLEAARTAALRGHDVVVREAATAAGGSAALAARAPHRAEMRRICEWLESEVRRLGVTVHYDSVVDVDVVESDRPDAVIVATGSLPRRDGAQRLTARTVPGADLPHVVTALEVLGTDIGARSALVFDDLGTYPAIGCTEQLLERGATVTLATSQHMFGPALIPTATRDPTASRLAANHRYTFRARTALTRITESSVVIRDLDAGVDDELSVDLVVLVTGFVAQRGLYEGLHALGIETHLVGDARLPLGLQHATASGYQAGRAI